MSKTLIITGTRKGLGKELAEHYLAHGFNVAGCSRGKASIEHENYSHYSLDVSDEKAVTKMTRDTRKKYGRIDALINNAGIASMNHFLTTPYEALDNIFRTNVFGTVLFSREVGKIMLKQKYGRIINYTTVAAAFRLEGEAIYAASKAAVENLTQTLSKELGEFGITVNAIGPTPVKTDLIRYVPEDKINGLLNRQAIKRFGEFRDVLNAVEFFMSDSSDFITGQVLYLGGVSN